MGSLSHPLGMVPVALLPLKALVRCCPRSGAWELLLPWHGEHQPGEKRGSPEGCPLPELSLLSIFFLKEKENH